MTTILEFAVVAVPLFLAVLAVLVLGRRHIDGQMKQIAEAAEARAAARAVRVARSNAAGASSDKALGALDAPPMADTAPPFSRGWLTLKDALVEFFARSKVSSRILRLLSTKSKPVGYKGLMDEIRFDEKWSAGSHDLPPSAIRAVLSITQAAGLVRLTRHGFSITEVGREVQRRIG